MPAAADTRKSREPASTKNLVALYEGGHLLQAEALAKDLIGLAPREHLAWKVLGAIQLANNQFGESLASSHRCLEIFREDAAVYNNIGVAHLGLDDLEAARNAFELALALAPNYAKALNGLGTVYLRQKKLTEAEHLCRDAAAQEPEYEKAWLNLGHICELQHKLTEAAESYQHALKINPRNYAFISDLLQIVTHDSARDAEQVALLHRQYGAHFDQFAKPLGPFANDKTLDRPLVIGFVDRKSVV